MAPTTLTIASDDILELREIISKGSLEFEEWTSLISEIEKIYPDDVEKICLVYDRFLSNFPLCYGYWRKYAAHMACLCTMDKVVEVFEKAILAIPYSVGMWVDYCNFGMSAFEDPSDIRRLFKRAISFVGKDYLCHTLWDKYIHFEFSQQQWVSLASIYLETLKLPTKKLNQYYDRFKKLITSLEKGIASLDNAPKELQSEPCFDGKIPMTMCCKDDKIYSIIKDMMDSSVGFTGSVALQKYRIIGEQLYHNACKLNSNISSFEANIRRYHFHVQPLDASQLQTWHDYLDFIELQGDFDWAVKLYERCLIVCANYPEYWMRYVDFMEAKGGRELANYSLDRATEIYLKSVPAIHLFNARFKEQIGDVAAARAAYIQSGKETDSDFVENVISKANMEKRLGNMESAFSIYKEALEMAAAKEKLQALPILYVHFSRLKYMSTNSVDAAKDVLIDGIRILPQNKLLLEELIKFTMMHGRKGHVAAIDSIVADAICPRSNGSQGLSTEDAEDISNLYLKFVDYCGTIHDVRKAWNRHRKLFPDSARISLHLRSTECRRTLNLIKDKREAISIAMPNQAPSDSSSDIHAHLSQMSNKASLLKHCDTLSDATDGGLILMENPISQSSDTDAHRVPIMELDDKAEDNGRELHLPVSEEPRDNGPENNVSSADLVEMKEESAEVVKNLKSCSGSDISSDGLLHQTASGNQSLQALQASSNENAAFSQGRCDLEPEESKLQKPRESPFPDSRPMTPQEECDTKPESSKSNIRAVVSVRTSNQDHSASTQDSESAQIHVEINTPYSACRQDHRARKSHLPPRSSKNGGGKWNQMRNAGKFRRGPKYGYRGNTQRKQHQRQQLSPQQIHPAEGGAQMPVTPGYPSQSMLQVQQCSQGQNQFQASATPDFVTAHNWPMQNIQTQNSSSQSPSPAAANTSSQVLQYAVQGDGQYGYVQNGQEYNQMWQYYYYQQQQQQLQLQQHYIQLQQQSLQQEPSQQLQQQGQPAPVQSQQLQQLLLQQQVLLQQQYFQQQQQPPQQQQHPAYVQQLQPSAQSSSNLVADQGQESLTLQGHVASLSQQSSKPGLVSSPVLHHQEEKPTQQE